VTPRSYHIRHATPADAPAIIQVHSDSVRLLCTVDYTTQQIAAWERQMARAHWLRGKVPQPRYAVLVAEEPDGSIIGFAERWRNEIYAVYVHPFYTRRGIGRALLGELERSAREDGIEALQVAGSLTAEPFYLACGYEIDSRGTFTFQDGTSIACVRMSKCLQTREPAREWASSSSSS
jgi:putative acetyltransferase